MNETNLPQERPVSPPIPISTNSEEEMREKTPKPNKICPHCGQEIAATAKKCRHCGQWLEKQCPYCGEWINVNAEKCKHCGNWLSELARRRYENRMGITRDRKKAQKSEEPMSDNDKLILGLAKVAGCFMHVENFLLAICLIVACGINFWLSILLCVGFYLLMCISAIRKLYVWVMTFMWGCVGYGCLGWFGAILFGIVAFLIHGVAIAGIETEEELKKK